MDRLKNVMWWAACAAILVGFGLCGVGIIAIDRQIEHDAYSHARIGLVHVLGIMLAICVMILVAAGLMCMLIRMFRSNDPDVGTNDDSQYVFDGNFPDSPNLPR